MYKAELKIRIWNRHPGYFGILQPLRLFKHKITSHKIVFILSTRSTKYHLQETVVSLLQIRSPHFLSHFNLSFTKQVLQCLAIPAAPSCYDLARSSSNVPCNCFRPSPPLRHVRRVVVQLHPSNPRHRNWNDIKCEASSQYDGSSSIWWV